MTQTGIGTIGLVVGTLGYCWMLGLAVHPATVVVFVLGLLLLGTAWLCGEQERLGTLSLAVQVAGLLVVLLLPGDVLAQAMPWEKPINTVAVSLTGPIARNAFIIACAIGVFMWWAGFSIITTFISIIVGGAFIANLDAIAGLVGF